MFSMENQSNKKVLCECSNMQCSLYLGHGNCIKKDCCSASCSSIALIPNMSANPSLFSKMLSNMGGPLIGDQPTFLGNANSLTPSKSESEAKPNCEVSTDKATPSVDFSALTAADFSITPKSFTMQHKGESKSLLKKFRRRSTVGVRGSPENNSLIRHIARQKRTRKQVMSMQGSPFKQRNTLLKDKIAAFQSSFKPLEETEEEVNCLPNPFNEADTRLQEQSKLRQVWPSEYKRDVFEESLNHKSISRARSSAVIQVHNIVPPSQKLFLTGSIAVSKTVPAFLASTIESGCMPLETAPSRDIPTAVCGIQSSHTGEELSINARAQHSSKKVRFSEKQRLEIFDQTKPPITSVQKGHLPSSSLRSVLKKTPVKMVTEGMKEHLDDTRIKEESEVLSNFKSCGALRTERSTGPIDEVKAYNKDLDSDVPVTLLPVNVPLCRRRRVPLSPSESREKRSPNVIPLKQSFSQPNFDHDDDLFQGPSEVVSTTKCSTNSDLEEMKGNSSDPQVVAVRTTRSSTRRKNINKEEETDPSPVNKMQAKNSKREHSKLQKAKPATKPSKKTPAARHKVFGKRRIQKEQKARHRQRRETASRKPLLSPIPEMIEDSSFMSSYQSTPKSQMSIFDDSNSSVLHAESMNETAESNSVLHSNEENSCLHSSLDLRKEDDISSSSSQLQDAAMYDTKAEKNFPEKMKSIFNENEQMLKSDCPSSEAEVQKERELLNLHRTGKDNKTKGASFFVVDSAVELLNEGNNLSFKRFPRRSRRLTCYLPSVGDYQSETPRNNSSVLGSNIEEILSMPQTGNDSEPLNNSQFSIEESFRGVTRKVRRSMRKIKDAENEGLGWIQIPANNSISQAPLGSACKARRQRFSSGPQESELLHQKQVNGVQMLLPIKEEQENTISPYVSRRRRKSICLLSLEENKNVVLHVQKNRRASLGYKSDHCYRKDSEMRKFLENHPVV